MHDEIYKLWDRVVICSGRLKGEKGTVIGSTDLNMDHRVIITRDNKRARDNTVGFHTDELRKTKANKMIGNCNCGDKNFLGCTGTKSRCNNCRKYVCYGCGGLANKGKIYCFFCLKKIRKAEGK